MLHAYVERFDVMGGRGNILGLGWEVNKAINEVLRDILKDWEVPTMTLDNCSTTVL
jgi:urea transporter